MQTNLSVSLHTHTRTNISARVCVNANIIKQANKIWRKEVADGIAVSKGYTSTLKSIQFSGSKITFKFVTIIFRAQHGTYAGSTQSQSICRYVCSFTLLTRDSISIQPHEHLTTRINNPQQEYQPQRQQIHEQRCQLIHNLEKVIVIWYFHTYVNLQQYCGYMYICVHNDAHVFSWPISVQTTNI